MRWKHESERAKARTPSKHSSEQFRIELCETSSYFPAGGIDWRFLNTAHSKKPIPALVRFHRQRTDPSQAEHHVPIRVRANHAQPS